MRGITTLYPGGISTWEAVTDHVTPVDKVFLDSIGFEFYAIEYTLGIDVNKGFPDVAARLTEQESDIDSNTADIITNESAITALQSYIDDNILKFKNRSPSSADYNCATFPANANWQQLDISAIITETTAVACIVKGYFYRSGTTRTLRFTHPDYETGEGQLSMQSYAGTSLNNHSGVVGVKYIGGKATISWKQTSNCTGCDIRIVGWWYR